MGQRTMATRSTSLKPKLAPIGAPLAEPGLFGPPALLRTESLQNYQALEGELRSAIVPQDPIEELWLRDVVDLQWELLRLRRLKAKHLETAAPKGLERIIETRVAFYRRDELIMDWATRAPGAIKEVKEHLAASDLDEEAIVAETLVADLDAFEKLDRMIAQAESRRNAILREFDRHRDAKAARERKAPIEDAEFREIHGGRS